jgi:hypothetical protein
MHPLDIEPQFVDMKCEEFSEPFFTSDKFDAEVGYMLHTYIYIYTHTSIYTHTHTLSWGVPVPVPMCMEVLVHCVLCIWAGHNVVVNI